ncbi:MAG: hypothetical protein EZS28_020639 [Streblomastix strix]|uniref:Uncharacterized protein n=1 Tax=Streblomastix strix TaxID=222440 RepID=A0A5J4VMP0_9EUKA|nr:MAG: hypothetical protein EZS28_020639 [Streblomastix strix]
MTVYTDETFLDAAGLMDFLELFAYIRERDSEPPVEAAPSVPVEEQTLQDLKHLTKQIMTQTVMVKFTLWTYEIVVEKELMKLNLMYKLKIYNADRTAYYVQDGPIVTFSFGAKLGNFMAVRIFSKFKLLVSKVNYDLSWVNHFVVKTYILPSAKQFGGLVPGGGIITKGIEAGSSALDAFNGQGSKQDANDKFNDLMSDPFLRNLLIESLSRIIKLGRGQL